MESVRVTVLLLLSADLLSSGVTVADHKPENVSNKTSAVSSVVLSNSTKNAHEANASASTALVQKPKLGKIPSPGQAANSSLAAAQQHLLQLEKAVNATDKEVKAKLKELKVQSALVKEKKDAVTQEQKQATDMKARAEKLQKEAEVSAEIAKEKSEAAAKLWKKEHAAASRVEDLQAEENETHKFLVQTQKEEATLEHSRVGLHEQLSRIHASLISMTKGLITATPHMQQLANTTHSSSPNGNMTGNGTKVTPRLRTGATAATAASPTLARNNTASMPEGSNETWREAMSRVQAENERLKHEKDELAKKLLLSQEKEELRLKMKQRLLKKEQRTLATKNLVKKH